MDGELLLFWPFSSRGRRPVVPCAEEDVPVDVEWLAEVGLDPPCSVVDVMILCIIREEYLERIKWQRVSAMIVDGLECSKREEEERLSGRHAGDSVCDGCADRVEKEAFKPVIIERTESIRDV